MKRYLLLAVLGITAIACSRSKHYITIRGFAQGTTYSMAYADSANRNLQPQIDSLLAEFDTSCSTYNPKSIITRINNNDTTVRADKFFTGVFNLSRKVWENTNGAFDITIGPLTEAWGFGFKKRMKLDSAKVDSLKRLVGMDKVYIENGRVIKADPRMFIDVDADAQGYSVDVVAKYLESKGIRNYMIEIGGEVYAKGVNHKGVPWVIGIDKPVDNALPGDDLQILVGLSGKAVATSGNYRKFYEENGVKYAHEIDPKSGYPVQHSVLSVSVFADDCGTADAYATAFMVLGLEPSNKIIERVKGLDAIFIYSDSTGAYKIYATPGAKKYIIEEEKEK
ncbi:MAG TPA: FAD:protein FMN transferase [Williamwhitmania sp.]|nr:FAD:protein FMN transferase [Williamwhitmania sp.]